MTGYFPLFFSLDALDVVLLGACAIGSMIAWAWRRMTGGER